MARTLVALGSNAPEAAEIFAAARRELEAQGWSGGRMSGVIRTAPVGCVPGTPDFFNAALAGDWPHGARRLLQVTQALEIAHGRPRGHAPGTARPLDIDIILCGGETIAEPDLMVPHPRALERDFVMIPLREIAPELEPLLRRLRR